MEPIHPDAATMDVSSRRGSSPEARVGRGEEREASRTLVLYFRAEHKHGARTGQETHTGPGRDRTRTRVLDGTRGDSTLAHA